MHANIYNCHTYKSHINIRMDFLKHIISVYVIAILILIHTSLLFCKSEECAFDASATLALVPKSAEQLITKLLKLIPLHLSTLQLIAQVLLVGDLILILSYASKLIGWIIRYVIGTIVLSLTICAIVYVLAISMDQPMLQDAKNKMIEIVNKLRTGADL